MTFSIFDDPIMAHEIKSAIVLTGGLPMFCVRCSCGRFVCTGPRLSQTFRRRAQRLAAEHIARPEEPIS